MNLLACLRRYSRVRTVQSCSVEKDAARWATPAATRDSQVSNGQNVLSSSAAFIPRKMVEKEYETTEYELKIITLGNNLSTPQTSQNVRTPAQNFKIHQSVRGWVGGGCMLAIPCRIF